VAKDTEKGQAVSIAIMSAATASPTLDRRI
jgi:hypothetical protein